MRRRLLVTGPSQAALADLEAAPADRGKILAAGPDPAAVADAVYGLVVAGRP